MTELRRMAATRETPLGEAIDFVLESMYVEPGASCPCCGGRVKVKRYYVSHKQARDLQVLARAYPNDLHWREWMTNDGRMQCSLRYLGLIEQPTGDPDKPFNRSGRWRITPTGLAWIAGELAIPKHAFVLYNELLGVSPERVTYAELLAGVDLSPEAAMGTVDPTEVT